MKNLTFLFYSILIITSSCNLNDEKVSIPDNVLQVFNNDNGKTSKLKGIDIQYLKDNFIYKESKEFDKYNFDIYQLPMECGSCVEYRILNIIGEHNIAFSLNSEYWVSMLSIAYNDSLNSKSYLLSHYLLRELLALEDNINLFIELELKNENEDSINAIINKLLIRYIGFEEFNYETYSSKSNYNKELLDSILTEENRNFSLYSFKETIVKVEFINNKYLSIDFINPEKYEFRNF